MVYFYLLDFYFLVIGGDRSWWEIRVTHNNVGMYNDVDKVIYRLALGKV